MPIYEYQCEKCNAVSENITYVQEKTLTEIECPVCKKGKAKKIMSVNGAFIIHGYNSMNGYDTVMR